MLEGVLTTLSRLGLNSQTKVILLLKLPKYVVPLSVDI